MNGKPIGSRKVFVDMVANAVVGIGGLAVIVVALVGAAAAVREAVEWLF